MHRDFDQEEKILAEELRQTVLTLDYSNNTAFCFSSPLPFSFLKKFQSNYTQITSHVIFTILI